jgi:hypothetical protein
LVRIASREISPGGKVLTWFLHREKRRRDEDGERERDRDTTPPQQTGPSHDEPYWSVIGGEKNALWAGQSGQNGVA